MGDVLSIRDTQSFTPRTGVYLTASSEFSELEKQAGLKLHDVQNLTKEQMMSIVSANPEFQKEFNKFAYESSKEPEKSASEMLDDMMKEAEFHEQCQDKNKAETAGAIGIIGGAVVVATTQYIDKKARKKLQGTESNKVKVRDILGLAVVRTAAIAVIGVTLGKVFRAIDEADDYEENEIIENYDERECEL